MFESDALLTPENIDILRTVILELNFVESIDGMVSLFSAREAPDETGVPPPLIPADVPKGAAFEALKTRILTNKIIGGKLISDDGNLALIVLALNRQTVLSDGLKKTVG